MNPFEEQELRRAKRERDQFRAALKGIIIGAAVVAIYYWLKTSVLR